MKYCRVQYMDLAFFMDDSVTYCNSSWDSKQCSYLYNAKLNLTGVFSIRDSENCSKQSKVICVENSNYKEENIFCENKNAECLSTVIDIDKNYIYYFYTDSNIKCPSSEEMIFFHCQPIKSDYNKV